MSQINKPPSKGLEDITSSDVIDKNSPVPLHHQLEQFLRDGIDNGRFPANERLPTEQELMAFFGLSRTPVRQALGKLTNAGLVIRKRSLGTVVLPQRFEEQLSSLSTFTKEVEGRGQVPRAHLEQFKVQTADPKRIKYLKLAQGAKVYFIQRVRFIDDVPVGVLNSYIPVVVAPYLLETDFKETGSQQSIYHVLRHQHNIKLVRATETFKAVLLDRKTAALLNHPPDSPFLLRSRIAYDETNRPIAYENGYYSVSYRIEWMGEEIANVANFMTDDQIELLDTEH
ncbi:GntR family transcriptional regulator [Candidatus Leptofilum sp.]|uniref:GntR family transcriptional regulator n=1 Tax=Candidatus Leptofilum sp. TaxID=3241576 RepID=UPI003B5A32E5